MTDRALVKNAADVDQVQRARRKERDRDDQLTDAIRSSLQHPDVRQVFAEILDRAGLFKTSYDHSGSMVYFNEGRRNFGLELRSLLETADEQAVDLMDQERRARKRAENRSVDAAHLSREAQGNQ